MRRWEAAASGLKSVSMNSAGFIAASIACTMPGFPFSPSRRSSAKTLRVGNPPPHEYESLNPDSLKKVTSCGPER